MKTIHFSTRKAMFPIFLIFSFFFCSITHATTYYISPTGNDATGTGTISNPWKTLFKATSTVSTSGDIIHINAGSYTETQQCVLAAGVSLEGDGITSIVKSTYAAMYEGIIKMVSPVGSNGNQHISNIKFDGQNLTNNNCLVIQGRSNVSIHDCTIQNFINSGIILNGETYYSGVAPAIYATGNTVYNNIINNCAGFAGNGDGCIQIGGQDGLLIHDNTITQNQRPSGQNGWPIKYYNNGYLNGCKIYHNTLTKIPYANDGWTFCIELFNESGLEIYNNTIQGSLDMNYQTKGAYAFSVWIHDNTFSQPVLNTYQEDGIIMEFGTQDAIIENNTFTNTGQCVFFVPRTGNTINNVTIRKNLASNIGITGDHQSSFINISGINTGIISNLNIYNNTFVGALGANEPYYGFQLSYNGTGGVETNFYIQNNIIANTVFSQLRFDGSTPTGTIVIKNNDLYNTSTPIEFLGNSAPTAYTNSGNISANPMFNTGAFTLSVASPCIDDGVYVGLPYSGTAPDRGYAELNIVLPVKLLDFTAIENKGKNVLQWSTATESNSDYFSIERSSDGQHFESIGQVGAAGFSSTIIAYNFTDATPLDGINYYRLVMQDKNASKDYSNIVAVLNKKDQSLSIATAQLSTGKNSMLISIASAQNQKANLSLFDTNGRMYLSETIQLQKGINTIDKTIPSVSKGIYYFKLYTGTETVVKNVFTRD